MPELPSMRSFRETVACQEDGRSTKPGKQKESRVSRKESGNDYFPLAEISAVSYFLAATFERKQNGFPA